MVPGIGESYLQDINEILEDKVVDLLKAKEILYRGNIPDPFATQGGLSEPALRD